MDEAAGFGYRDTLARLNDNISLADKLRHLHETAREEYPFIERIAVALYDAKGDLLKTFLHSSGGEAPLMHYQARLAESHSLQAIIDRGQPRVINDLEVFRQVNAEHSRRIDNAGYGASYTLPMYQNGSFFGFIFFNSRQKEVFTPTVLRYLDLIGHLLSVTVLSELGPLRTLLAAIKTATAITNVRDTETGAHLDRMSRYARIIALELAPKYDLSDEFIELLFMFSPLHDVGKIGIPDNILMKPGPLTDEEYAVMKTHTEKGREIVDTMLANFSLEALQHHGNMLRNIAEYHHEAIDGSGYPHGLRGEAIPVEARIVAVADVFDALTSRRPYKEAWGNERAFDILRQMADGTLDNDCVEALVKNRERIERIQGRFKEDPYG